MIIIGIFDKLFGSKNKVQTPSRDVNNYKHEETYGAVGSSHNNSNNSNSLNLRKEEALNTLKLRKDKLNTVCLKKSELSNLTARVCVAMDFSMSMSNLYRRGEVQELFERLFPLALKFDDNGELESWIFSDDYSRLEDINMDNFYNYVQDEIIHNHGDEMGSTNYAPVMRDIVRKYIEEEPSSTPTYVIFITDGDNYDKDKAEKVIRESSRHNIFWQFVGIGSSSFNFLEKLDEMQGRYIDNANFFECNNIKNTSDKELYDNLLQEFPDWINEAKQKNIIK